MKKGRDLKPHIGIFGKRNNGKSSLINLLAGQDISIVSSLAGTTTDPVKKSVEIFGIGPAIIIDTAGVDDKGDLGCQRINKTNEIIPQVDSAILVIAFNDFGFYETELIKKFREYNTPYIIVHNKSDIIGINEQTVSLIKEQTGKNAISFSCVEDSEPDAIIRQLIKVIPKSVYETPSLLKGIIKPKDLVLLVTPIDSEAPDGRMILPQVMAIRDVLDNDCISIVLKETALEDFLDKGIKPDLVITDSQAFDFVNKIIPKDIPLTGFSIVFARMRGDFDSFVKNTPRISKLKDGDKVLIMESCSHQVNCEDIGRIKLPKWIREFTGKKLQFDAIAGRETVPSNISEYALAIQCGGCMVTKKQLHGRLINCKTANVPFTNYGMSIAYMNGIFERAIKPLTKSHDFSEQHK